MNRILLAQAERVAALLIQRKETIAVSESSTGGLVGAGLLAVPGASAYCLGGVVLYTRQAEGRALGDRGERAPARGDGAGALRRELGAGRDRRERLENMYAFSARALEHLEDVLSR